MNIHEYQAKELLKKFGIPVPNGVIAFSNEEILQKIKLIKTKKYVLKAQIHAGGRGKAGGIKILESIDDLIKESSKLFGKFLKTLQTGPEGKKVQRLYIEEAIDISKEFYLSCLVDRASSKIAFISSTQGGMDIEEIAIKNPKKIFTFRLDYKNELSNEETNKIASIFNLKNSSKDQVKKIIRSIYQVLIKTDASLIEINPLVITKDNRVLCLDAKINFDDNGLYKHPEILKLRDLSEEDPIEIEASKHNLSYIKLNGKIGCMVNGAGLAMATMDIIKLHGEEPANFLDVGGGASKEKVAAAFKIILSDKSVKGILINIFGGIMRCNVLAQGVVEAAKETNISVPLVVRLAGTNFQEGRKILSNSDLKIISANNLGDAAKKIVEAIR